MESNGAVISLEPEKPWAILFAPYIKDRSALYCPSDTVAHTKTQALTMDAYQRFELPEPLSAQNGSTAAESYLLNSILRADTSSPTLQNARQLIVTIRTPRKRP